MSYGGVEEPSSSRSRGTSTVRRSATSAILTVILSRSDRARRNSHMVNARPGWDADLNAYGSPLAESAVVRVATIISINQATQAGLERNPGTRAPRQPTVTMEKDGACRRPPQA